MDNRFQRYKDGELTDEEFREFRDDVNQMSDEELSWHLDHLQADFDLTDDEVDTLHQELMLAIKMEKRRSRRLRIVAFSSVAAAICILIVSAFMISDLKSNSVPKALIAKGTTIATQRGERASVMLPDSSRVTLGPESTLTYELSSFVENNRAIAYSGQGDFKIHSDKAHPFTIVSGELQVTVTGTEFTIVNRKESNRCEVELTQGVIDVRYGAKGRSVTMNENETAVIDKTTGTMQIIGSDTHNISESKTGLIYQSAPLAKIAADIRRYYDVEICISPAYRASTFTGLIPTNNLELALFTLNQTIGQGAIAVKR